MLGKAALADAVFVSQATEFIEGPNARVDEWICLNVAVKQRL